MGEIVGRFLLPHPPIIIPEVGKERAKLGINTIEALKKVGEAIKELAPDTIVIVSPHAPFFDDHFYINENQRCSGDLAQFDHKEIMLGFNCDLDLIAAIKEKAKGKGLKSGELPKQLLRSYGFSYDLDHGVIVPLWFVNHFYSQYQIVAMGLTTKGPKDHYLMGQAIEEAVAKSSKKVVVIASGDMSHKLDEDGPYGFNPQGPKFDSLVEKALKNGDAHGILSIDPALEEDAAQCGLPSLWVLCGTMEKLKFSSRVLAHEWPFGIGYLTAEIKTQGKTVESPLANYLAQKERDLKQTLKNDSPPQALARLALSHYLDNGEELEVPQDTEPEWLENTGGVFVCFKKEGQLRGCIGTIAPTQPNLAEEIISNAIAAGTKDLRFSPITPGEIAALQVSVDLLSAPEDIEDIEELDPEEYGVIVSNNEKRGVLLPKLEGIDTPQDQVRIAREKAGIPFYKKVKLQRFKVVRYE